MERETSGPAVTCSEPRAMTDDPSVAWEGIYCSLQRGGGCGCRRGNKWFQGKRGQGWVLKEIFWQSNWLEWDGVGDRGKHTYCLVGRTCHSVGLSQACVRACWGAGSTAGSGPPSLLKPGGGRHPPTPRLQTWRPGLGGRRLLSRAPTWSGLLCCWRWVIVFAKMLWNIFHDMVYKQYYNEYFYILLSLRNKHYC